MTVLADMAEIWANIALVAGRDAIRHLPAGPLLAITQSRADKTGEQQNQD
jgi:hypothetical protein